MTTAFKARQELSTTNEKNTVQTPTELAKPQNQETNRKQAKPSKKTQKQRHKKKRAHCLEVASPPPRPPRPAPDPRIPWRPARPRVGWVRKRSTDETPPKKGNEAVRLNLWGLMSKESAQNGKGCGRKFRGLTFAVETQRRAEDRLIREN